MEDGTGYIQLDDQNLTLTLILRDGILRDGVIWVNP